MGIGILTCYGCLSREATARRDGTAGVVGSNPLQLRRFGPGGCSLSAGLSEVSRHQDSDTVVPLTLPVVWLSKPADRPPVAAGNGSRIPSALRVRRRRHGRRLRSPA